VTERVHIRGFCQHDDLIGLLKPDRTTLLIVDIESAEIELLDPDKIPALYTTTMLVETHDLFNPNCSRVMQARFGESHQIKKVASAPRPLSLFPLKGLMTPRFMMEAVALDAMNEGRPDQPQEWFLMLPNVKKPA
jgi:hypothetical protein